MLQSLQNLSYYNMQGTALQLYPSFPCAWEEESGTESLGLRLVKLFQPHVVKAICHVSCAVGDFTRPVF